MSQTLNNELVDFLTKRHIDQFLSGILPSDQPLSGALRQYASLPPKGAHLETPRMGGAYTHHGIYIGNEKVVHYSGLAKKLNSGPVEEVSLEEFIGGNSYRVIPHDSPKFSPDEAIKRAVERIGEEKYNLFINNCEHFVQWCLYDRAQSRQVEKGIALASRALPVAPVKYIASVYETKRSIQSYIKGNISKGKLVNEISETAITTSSIAFYAAFGQAAIPIPIVGSAIGATVGYVVGSMINSTGLIALGESDVVKVSRERRERVEKISQQLISHLQESRKQFEAYVHQYAKDRQKNLIQSLDLIGSTDQDTFLSGLERLSELYGTPLKYKDHKEFRADFNSDKPLKI
jgi:hypothetical protein